MDPILNIILSTRNPSKAEQIKAIFAGTPFNVLTLTEAGIEGKAVEDGNTLEENALKKCHYAREHGPKGAWTMSDDTGLFITHLNGQPGIWAARWAGETASTEDIMQHTLRKLKGAADRSATFETVVAIVDSDGKEYLFKGICEGTLLDAPRAEPQPEMPYSPLFRPHGSDKVWAEMETDEENAVSHRGKAFRAARAWLETQT
ncbi:non-canonical purine NTP pyrophosphatase [Candidatus Parcubacteria bacterium]|nr:non-canonical purine NTP pyrophosphatase [Candidatus Parcubacteria bacterium]